MTTQQSSDRPPRDREVHEPVGKVRTGLATNHQRAFSSRHIQAGSRAFDLLFRFVAGVPAGMVLASILRGGWREPVVFQNKWPHHPVSDSVALGFLIGVAIAGFPLAYFRAKEKFARIKGEPQPEFRWVGRRVAAVSFVLTYLTLWMLGSNGVNLLR